MVSFLSLLICCILSVNSISVKKASLSVETEFDNKENINPVGSVGTEDCTPKPLMPSRRGKQVTDSKQHHTTTKIASMLRNPSAKKQTNPLQLSHTRGIKPANVKRFLIIFTVPHPVLDIVYFTLLIDDLVLLFTGI